MPKVGRVRVLSRAVLRWWIDLQGEEAFIGDGPFEMGNSFVSSLVH